MDRAWNSAKPADVANLQQSAYVLPQKQGHLATKDWLTVTNKELTQEHQGTSVADVEALILRSLAVVSRCYH